MANRNWDKLNRSAKIMTVTKITLIGAAGVAVVLFTRKAIIDFTGGKINEIIEPLMKDAPEAKLEADVQ